MLKALFEWLDRHPESYWAIAFLPTLLLAAWLWQAVRERGRNASPPTHTGARGGAWLDALVLLAFLLAWRWPYLLVAHDINPDESQLIAGALTLAHDPVFWRSVDGTTSGPLNFYALLPIVWLGAPLDYFTARLLGLLLVWTGLFACHRLLVNTYGRAVAALAVLPATVFFATATAPDFIHYSSEHLAIALVAGAAWLLARAPTRSASDVHLWAACFLAGAAPWAKLQTAPISIALIGWACWQALTVPPAGREERRSRTTNILLAAVVPTVVAISAILATGQLEAAVRRYVLHNVLYVGATSPGLSSLGRLWIEAIPKGTFSLFLLGVIVPLLGGAIVAIRRQARPQPLWLAGGALTAAALVAVLVPRREFLHYLLLMVVPLTVWAGAAVGEWWHGLRTARSRRIVALALVITGAVIPITIRSLQPEPFVFGHFADHWRHPRVAESAIARDLTEPGDPIAIWGWANHIYVESGRPQATRDAHSLWSIAPNAQQDYHRSEWLGDFVRNRPVVFLDAVGPGSFAYTDRSLHGHEIFPALADHVREHYALLVDLRHARIYARLDHLARAPVRPADLKRPVARSRMEPPVEVAAHRIAPPDAARADVGDRVVQLLLPPAELAWRLEGTERVAVLDYGFHPRAYLEGESNGADLIVELRAPKGPPRRIFNRRLDPARQARDRGELTSRLTLPPFGPGTELVVRTEPGEHGDNAWDWIYFSGARFHHSAFHLPEQFPRFDPVPDAVNAELSHLVEEGGQPLLMLPAPATLTFNLGGDERRLRFAYGFQSGAYSGRADTDGAIFRATLIRPGQPDRTLFERHLRPLHDESDRGRQETDLALVGIEAGSRLELTIDPGDSPAWDWTYLTDLVLQ